MKGFSQILDMNVTRDYEKGVITISQNDYTEDVIQCYGIEGCNSAYTPRVGPELSLNQSRVESAERGRKEAL